MTLDDVLDILFILFLAASLFFVGYKVGSHFTDRHWRRLIPAAMDKLCYECAGLKDENPQ